MARTKPDWSVLLIAGKAMTVANAAVTGNRIVQGDSTVIECDAIHPGLLGHPDLRDFVASGALRMVVLEQDSEAEMVGNMIERGRGEHRDPGAPVADAREAYPRRRSVVASDLCRPVADQLPAGPFSVPQCPRET